MLIYFFSFYFFIKKLSNNTITEAINKTPPKIPIPISLQDVLNIPYKAIIKPTNPVSKKNLKIYL